MKIGWKHILVWLCLTAAITFVVLTFGEAASQIIQQVFGINLAISAEMTPAMYAAVALVCAFQAAVLTLVGTIFLFVFGQFASFDRDFRSR